MMLWCLQALLMPVLTSTFLVILVYLIFIGKKVREEAREKNRAMPNVERLKKSLPLTVSASWKLGGVVNGVPIWENRVFSSEAGNGIIASQALLQAPAETVIKEMAQPRMLQLIHPLINDTSLPPGMACKQSEESEIKSDLLSLECNVQSISTLRSLYFKFKTWCLVKRRWKFGNDGVSWLILVPDYKVHEHLFGTWQCCVAIDIPSEGKESTPSMSLLSIFAAPSTDDNTRLLELGNTIAAQVVSIREHIDLLYLKKMLRKDSNISKRKSTIEQKAKAQNGENAMKSKGQEEDKTKILGQNLTPVRSLTGSEGRGLVESPAEINSFPLQTTSPPKEQIESKDMSLITKKLAPYKETLDTAYELLLDVYHANEMTPGWTYLGNRNDIEIYRMPGDSSCPSDCFKGTVEVNVPISYALQYLTELNFKKEWDDVFNEGKVIEEIDEVTKVTHMDYKPVWPTTARDFCCITATRHIKGDIYAMAVKATTHPSCPPMKGRQRAEIIVGGFVVEGISTDPPQCKVTYVTRADLKGKIPASMVNKVNEKQPMYTGIIRDKMEERYTYQDPPDEGNCKIVAARRHPSILEAAPLKTESKESGINAAQNEDMNVLAAKPDTIDSEGPRDDVIKADLSNQMQTAEADYRELSKTEIEALIPENGAQWDAMSETSMTSMDRAEEFQDTISEPEGDAKPLAEQNLDLPRDSFGNLDFKTLGNQTAAKLLEEALLASKVDSTSKLPAIADQPEVWTYQGTYRNVVVLRKIHNDSNFYSFLGRGVMNVLPVTVWEAVKNPSTRFVYDNMLKKTAIAKEFEEGLKVLHMRHETTACFVRQARDFVILARERVDPGKYIIAATSIDIPECPLEKNCIRGKVLASGWIIEPVLNKGRPCSLVTYLSQVDFGGKLPIRLINLIAKRQPMSVAYLRSYLEAAEKRD